jgi:hypothetical protein
MNFVHLNSISVMFVKHKIGIMVTFARKTKQLAQIKHAKGFEKFCKVVRFVVDSG